MTIEQYKTFMLENATVELNRIDKLIGTISSMKGNTKFNEAKENIKLVRATLKTSISLFENNYQE